MHKLSPPTLPALLLPLLLLHPARANAAVNDTVASRASKVEAAAQQWPRADDLQFAAQIQRAYADNFAAIDGKAQLRWLDDAALKQHWLAVDTAAFYSADDTITDAVLRVFAELEQRKLADDKATSRIFNALLKARRFDAARAFSHQHPQARLPEIPALIDSGTHLPSVWQFSTDGSVLKRIGIDLQPLQIIVAAGCHFSADAAKDIAADPLLGPVFSRHARWLSLPPGGETLDALKEWNRTHPQTPMLAIHDRSEWAVIPRWSMPTFAIIQDGKLIDSSKGWRSGAPEFRSNLIALLVRAGLLPADAR